MTVWRWALAFLGAYLLLEVGYARAQALPVPLKPIMREAYSEPYGPPAPILDWTPTIRALPPEEKLLPAPQQMLRWSPTPNGKTMCSANPAGVVECGPGYWHPVE